jgi:hypothetical protein
MSIEVMKLWLEALENTHTQPGCEQWIAERKASVALRAAIEQTEVQEPRGYQWFDTAVFRKKLPENAELSAWHPLYTTIPAAAHVQDWLVTEATLRRLHDELEPLSEMENEAQVSAWWKHFAGKVRLELKRATPTAAAHVQEPIGKLCVFDDPESEFGWSYDEILPPTEAWEIAAELRRLYAVNKQLLEALEECLGYMDAVSSDPATRTIARAAIEAAREQA